MVSVRPRHASGFTLPELMAVVLIMAVLGSIAAPSLKDMVSSQRSKGVSSDLFTSLIRARSEAIKRNTEVTLRPASAGQWQAGWSIPNPADSGNPLENHGPVPPITVAGPASVVYLANGRLKGATAPSFQISAGAGQQVRCIQIDLSGRPSQTTGTCTS
ncbi:MAG: prepilin-type N-terminal cleavage/methylation protein [Massilia sp.]|nr:prepilin-type N-terminal cleavage/methylation protein [Massilia sp.]